MYIEKYSTKFKKEYKLAKKQGKDINTLKQVINLLKQGQPLPEKNKDHALIGNYVGSRECHLESDWLLIYNIDNSTNTLNLLRLGSHTNLLELLTFIQVSKRLQQCLQKYNLNETNLGIKEDYKPERITENILWEMANLAPKETGLPVYIYISDRRNAKHGPRVKFMTQKGSVKPSLLAEITVEDEPKLVCQPKLKRAAMKYFKDMIPWVKENRDILLALYRDELTEREASNLIADKYVK